jgi:hypothetical protein
MKYTVRAAEGQLTFQSFGELERALWDGLVDPDDEVQEEGSTSWRKVRSYAVLRRPRPMTSHEQAAQRLWLALGVALGSVALGAFNCTSLGMKRYGLALAAAALLALVLGRLARGASRRER